MNTILQMAQKNANYTTTEKSQYSATADSVKAAASLATRFILFIAALALFATSGVQFIAMKRNKKLMNEMRKYVGLLVHSHRGV